MTHWKYPDRIASLALNRSVDGQSAGNSNFPSCFWTISRSHANTIHTILH